MVRNYRRKERIYPVDTLRKAVRQVLLRELTSSEAGRLYKIPRTTIINHVNGRSSGFNRGRRPVFTYDQEKMIVELTLAMSDSGVGLDMMGIRKIVQNFVRNLKLKTPFKDDLPGLDWLYT